jgi:hypothetical protein
MIQTLGITNLKWCGVCSICLYSRRRVTNVHFTCLLALDLCAESRRLDPFGSADSI